MKTLETIQRFSRLGRTLSKAAFVLAVIGFCGCVLGLFSLALGSDGAIHWGGVTIHGVLTGVEELGSVRAVLAGWLILCAGEAVLAKFAERYFRNELTAGTPFTLAGAGELRRLGIRAAVFHAPLELTAGRGCAYALAVAPAAIRAALQAIDGMRLRPAAIYFQDGNRYREVAL